MKLKVTFLVSFLLALSHSQVAQTTKKIFLKLDDLAVKNSSSPGLPTIEYLVNKKVKASYGFVASRNDETLLSILSPYLNAKDNNGEALIEIWHHGYDHVNPEFKGTGYAYQKEHFENGNTILNALFGLKMYTFGAPFNATDNITNTVVSENDAYKVTFFQNPAPSASSGILNLLNRVNIENGTGNPEYTYFVNNYNNQKNNFTDFMVLQGHPNVWNSTKLGEFKKIIDFLIAEGWEFDLPYDYYAELNGITLPTTIQTITFPDLSAKEKEDADFDPGATSTSGLEVFYNSSNLEVAKIVDGKIDIIGPGTAIITASQLGDATYKNADYVSKTLTVNGTVTTVDPVVSSLPVYENFDYAVGEKLIELNATVGLGIWSTTAERTSSGDLLIAASPTWSAVSGVYSPTGSALEFQGFGIKPEVLFTPQTGDFGQVYTSFLLKLTDVSRIGTDTSARFMGLGNSSGGSFSTATSLFVRLDAGGVGYNLGVNATGSNADITWLSTVFATDEEVMVVLSFDDSNTEKTGKLWVNPILNGTEPAVTIEDPDAVDMDINAFQIYKLNNANTPRTILDELRIGKTWVSVTGDPTLSINVFEKGEIVFANPVKDNLIFSTKDISITSIKVFNIVGQQVLSKKIDDINVELKVSDLKKGLYLFSLETEKGTYNSKFIKE